MLLFKFDLNNDDTSYDTFFLFKPKILSATEFLRDRKKSADLGAILDHLAKIQAYSADKELVENLLTQLINCKLIINKKTQTGLDSCRLTIELLNEFRRDADEESQNKHQNDVHEENLNEHGRSLIQHTKFK